MFFFTSHQTTPRDSISSSNHLVGMSYGRPTVDLDSYAGLYRNRSKIKRLQHIARTEPSLEVDALTLAIKEAKKGRDTVLYKNLVSGLNGRGDGSVNTVDQRWIDEQDVWAAKELDKLRRELEEVKEQNSRETVRTAHMDLGDFYHRRGKLQQARGEYIKSRDHCVQPQHSLFLCLRTIVVSLESGDFANVENYHHMAENAIPENMPAASKSHDLSLVRASAALALLVRGRYKEAADRFLSVVTDPSEERLSYLQQNFGEPISLEDVATFGSLCALATLDRPTLKKKVLESSAFRALLELVPDMRELIVDFHHSRYANCLDTLEHLRSDLVLDLYVGSDGHIDRLYNMIRQEALVQYVSPFLTTDLARMEKVFKTTPQKLETELYNLIESGAISARIDTQRRALYRKPKRTQAAALEKAVKLGEEKSCEVEAMLLRMSLVKNGLTLPASGAMNGRLGNLLGGRSGSINSITDSGFGNAA